MKWLDDFVSFAQECVGPSEREALHSRGASLTQIQDYRLGFLEDLPCVDVPEGFTQWWRKHALADVLVLPLTNTLGQVKGIQCRSIHEGKKGYVDFFASQEETALFGLAQAMPSIWDSGKIFLVEGAFDLFPVQRHIPHVVATLHAGISGNLWKLLRRLVSEVYLGWDSDPTGWRVSADILKSERAKAFSFKWVRYPNVPFQGKSTKDPSELWEAWGDARLGVFLREQQSFNFNQPGGLRA